MRRPGAAVYQTLVSGRYRLQDASEDFFDDVNRPIGADFPDANGDQAIEEGVLRRGRFETWRRAEIVVRVVPHAGERHVNQGPVVGFECDA